jgi:hypothetical protein
MKRLKASIVAKSFAACLFLFTILCTLVPYETAFYSALSAAFGVCVSAVIRYGRDALLSFRDGRTGADFLIVAIFAIVSVVLSLIVYWFAIRLFPESLGWLSRSAVSIGVPLFLAWAIFLSLLAPDMDLSPEEAKSGIWKSVALFIGGALAGFVIAASIGARDKIETSQSWPHLANRASCRPGDVWVSSRGVYHTQASPYRGSVVPRYCFSSAEKAEEAGFKPPR